MVSRPQEVPTDSEEILHDTVNRREPLELSGRLETPHLALTLSGRRLPSSFLIVSVFRIRTSSTRSSARCGNTK